MNKDHKVDVITTRLDGSRTGIHEGLFTDFENLNKYIEEDEAVIIRAISENNNVFLFHKKHIVAIRINSKGEKNGSSI